MIKLRMPSPHLNLLLSTTLVAITPLLVFLLIHFPLLFGCCFPWFILNWLGFIYFDLSVIFFFWGWVCLCLFTTSFFVLQSCYSDQLLAGRFCVSTSAEGCCCRQHIRLLILKLLFVLFCFKDILISFVSFWFISSLDKTLRVPLTTDQESQTKVFRSPPGPTGC